MRLLLGARRASIALSCRRIDANQTSGNRNYSIYILSCPDKIRPISAIINCIALADYQINEMLLYQWQNQPIRMTGLKAYPAGRLILVP